MLRRFCFVALIAVAVTSAWTELYACGDKFLRPGRSPRMSRYASVHPSAILVYAQRWTPAGIKDFETLLRRAGHRPVTVTNQTALAQALTTAKYDLVITSYAYAADTSDVLRANASTAALLPLVYKPTKHQEKEARTVYQHFIRPDKMTPFEALEEIDHLAGLRLKGAGAAVAR
jgi:hypothetical protein